MVGVVVRGIDDQPAEDRVEQVEGDFRLVPTNNGEHGAERGGRQNDAHRAIARFRAQWRSWSALDRHLRVGPALTRLSQYETNPHRAT